MAVPCSRGSRVIDRISARPAGTAPASVIPATVTAPLAAEITLPHITFGDNAITGASRSTIGASADATTVRSMSSAATAGFRVSCHPTVPAANCTAWPSSRHDSTSSVSSGTPASEAKEPTTGDSSREATDSCSEDAAARGGTAGRAWLKVLANQVEVDEVTTAARTLAQFGHTWDATRLAGQAALQTSDPRISQAMLQLARDLKHTVAGEPAADLPDGETATAATVSAAPARPAAAHLSDREREVAELLLQGLPYRDIGAQLFISAKTVEHHVARIRRRLGAESRSELLSMLRALMDSRGGR